MLEPRRRFRFIKELSEGAFGKVYLAEMITGDAFKSVVAIKLLHGKWAGHEEIVQRSRDEARVLGLLHHRNIIRVDDLTSINGQCAIVMEYLDGVDLKTLINRIRDERDQGNAEARFPRKVAFEVISQIAAALEAAYNARPLGGGEPLRVIHRDIKPSNVMVTVAGDVKVLDFGTAQARFDEREAHTQALAFGSAAYMAPERLLGDPDAPNGDIFSLGITLYELLTLDGFGKINIRPEKFDQRLERKLEEIPLDDLDPRIAAEVRGFVERLLSYEAGERPTAAQIVEVAEDLAEKLNDAALRRFCREVVKPCREAMQPAQDPDDPLTGSTVFEDSSSLRPRGADEAPPSEVTGEFPTVTPVAAEGADAARSGLRPAADLARSGAQPAVTSGMRPAADPARSGAQPAVTSGMRPAPPPPSSSGASARAVPGPTIVPPPPGPDALSPDSLFSAPTRIQSADDDDDIRVKPVPATPEPPRPAGPAVTPSKPVTETRAPARPPAPKPAPPPVEPPPKPSGGNMGKIIVGLGLLGLLVVGGGAAVFFSGILGGGASEGSGESGGPKANVPKSGIGGRVVQVGAPDAARGKITLILQPPGKAEVSVNSTKGDLKEDWDGSGKLELVGVEAGNYKTKVAPTGGSAKRATFEAKAGQDCTYTFDVKQGTEWIDAGCKPL